jgi:hypothetical protein
VGIDAVREPLSPARETEIRLAVRKALESLPASEEPLFDVQVVADVLAEVDRLRAKLHLASHAGALTEQAAAKLRDASADITPRPPRFRKGSTPDPNE